MFGKAALEFILNPYESPPRVSTLEQVYRERADREDASLYSENEDEEMKQEPISNHPGLYSYYYNEPTYVLKSTHTFDGNYSDDDMDGGDCVDDDRGSNEISRPLSNLWTVPSTPVATNAPMFSGSLPPLVEHALSAPRAIPTKSIISVTTPLQASTASAATACATDAAAAAMANASVTKKKKTTVCKEPGCTSQSLSKQLCMKHGGGPRCTYPDCTNGAKLKNLCFQHGGSTTCLAEGCASKAKRFGYCWSHGGGRICSEEDCNKVAAQGGLCWAHGGGNRCKLPGCTKRSYKQHGYYCKRHADVFADY